MLVDTRNLVPISEANQNFSRVARLVDDRGSVVILRNNKPSYVVTKFATAEEDEFFDEAYVAELGRQLIAQHRVAFEELAK